MLNIADYYDKAMISQDESVGEDCYAYSMDGHPDKKRGGERDMAKHIGLPSCHCCDCFIFENESISLIEITDISRSKKKMKEEFSYLSDENAEDFFIASIAKENILKMYGSMAVLCWVARKCKTMEKNLKGKYKFWLVFPNYIKDSKVFDMIEIKLRDKMKSVASGFLVEVVILSPKELNEKIRENAISV